MALEHFFYGNDTPTPTSIKDMILALILSADEGDVDALDSDTVGEIVNKLVDVYWKLLEATDEEAHEAEYDRSCDGGEAMYALFRKVYIKTYRSEWRADVKRSKHSKLFRQDAGDDEDIAEGMTYGDCLGYYLNGGYTLGSFPRWLPIIAAKAMAQRESARSVKMAEWNIESGIPGTSGYKRLRRDCGAEASDKHAADIARIMAEASDGT